MCIKCGYNAAVRMVNLSRSCSPGLHGSANLRAFARKAPLPGYPSWPVSSDTQKFRLSNWISTEEAKAIVDTDAAVRAIANTQILTVDEADLSDQDPVEISDTNVEQLSGSESD